MEMYHCPNCDRSTGFRRAFGWGTFFAIFITFGLWILILPFYPKRCIICGEGKRIFAKGGGLHGPSHRSNVPEQKSPEKKKVLYAVLLIVIFFFFIFSILKSMYDMKLKPVSPDQNVAVAPTEKLIQETSQPTEPPLNEKLIEISPSDLTSEYERNKIRADNLFKEKLLSIRGYVLRIEKDIHENPCLVLDAGINIYWIPQINPYSFSGKISHEILCYFDNKKDESVIAKLNPGSLVNVVGRCKGEYRQHIYLDDCSIEDVAHKKKLEEERNERLEAQKKKEEEDFNNRGIEQYKNQNYRQAIVLFDRAIELNSNNSTFFSNRGKTYMSLKKYQNAITDFNQVIELDPQNSEAYYWRGLSKNTLGDREQAIKDLIVAAKLGNEEAKKLLDENGIKYLDAPKKKDGEDYNNRETKQYFPNLPH